MTRKEYEKSASPEMVAAFEKEILNRFGAVPAHVIGPDECEAIWQAVMSQVGEKRLKELEAQNAVMREALVLFVNAEAGNGWSDLRKDCIERMAYDSAKQALSLTPSEAAEKVRERQQKTSQDKDGLNPWG